MKEIFLKESNQYQIEVKQFDFIGVFNTLEEGRKAVEKLFKGE